MLQNVDQLTLSLDSLSDEVNYAMGRSSTQFKNIDKILQFIYSENLSIQLKINTVATTKNYDTILQMTKYLRKFPLMRWKVFIFNPL